MHDTNLTAADVARRDLIALASSVEHAVDAAAAWASYSFARTTFYDLPDDVQIDDGVRSAWAQVLAVADVKLDEFRTPISPLVVLR